MDSPVWLALPIGVGFGVLLERSGLASARTIADQLRFRDFTVVKVMLAAIVTAMLLAFWATRLGWLDPSRVGIPTTDLLPQMVGAIVFGAGFALAALCPGTACAAAGTGRLDGVAVVAGLFGGTLVVTLAWPRLGVLAEHADRGAALLPADLGLPTGTVVALVALGALLLLPLLDRIEGARTTPRWRPLAVAAVSLGALAVPAALSSRGATVDIQDAIAREIAAEADHVEPLDLAEWIRDGRPGLRVVDVRDDVADGQYVIPGAQSVPLAGIARFAVRPSDLVVLYADDGAHAAQAWVLLRSQGVRNVLVLRDGLEGWEAEVMAPRAADPATPGDAERARRAAALSAWFGGEPRPAAPGGSEPPSRRRRTTC
jgi:rhodanese-related sulfurtransferase/uncharacterized membrane protein YedE/YeeE